MVFHSEFYIPLARCSENVEFKSLLSSCVPCLSAENKIEPPAYLSMWCGASGGASVVCQAYFMTGHEYWALEIDFGSALTSMIMKWDNFWYMRTVWRCFVLRLGAVTRHIFLEGLVGGSCSIGTTVYYDNSSFNVYKTLFSSRSRRVRRYPFKHWDWELSNDRNRVPGWLPGGSFRTMSSFAQCDSHAGSSTATLPDVILEEVTEMRRSGNIEIVPFDPVLNVMEFSRTNHIIWNRCSPLEPPFFTYKFWIGGVSVSRLSIFKNAVGIGVRLLWRFSLGLLFGTTT